MNDSNNDGDTEIALSAEAKSEIWKAMWSTFVVPAVALVIVVFFLGFFAKDIFGLDVGGDPIKQEVSHLSEKNQKVAEAVSVAENMIAEVSELKNEAQRISSDLKSSEVMDQVRQELAASLKHDQAFIEKVSGSLNSGLDDLKNTLTLQSAFHASAQGPYVENTRGVVDKRFMNFSKKQDGTVLRIAYEDVFRVTGMVKACRWEVLLDGKSCTSDAPLLDFYSGVSAIKTAQKRIIGYCENVPAGMHMVSVKGEPVPGKKIFERSVCSTGAEGYKWSIEVLEVNTAQ